MSRSRFVTTLERAPSREAAHEVVARIRVELADATHHCWAFVAGPPGDTAHVGLSDAGEPKGTAGRPMLTALLHSGVGEVVAVCARWFGGTKLGTGGLARAYAGGVTHALAGLPTELRVKRRRLAIVIGYGQVEAVRQALAEVGGVLEGESYGEDVRYRVAVPEGALERFEARLADATAGRARVERAEEG